MNSGNVYDINNKIPRDKKSPRQLMQQWLLACHRLDVQALQKNLY